MRGLDFKLLVVILASVGLVVQIATCAREDDVKPTSEGTAETTEETRPAARGLLGMLLSPIRATLDSAKRLLGMPAAPSRKGIRDFVMDGVDELQLHAFRLFMRAYNKTYESPAEIRRRMGLFLERRKMIEQSVRDFAEGRIGFIMRENTYTDWDDSELRALASAAPPRTYQEMTEDERETMMKSDQEQGDLKKRDPSSETLIEEPDSDSLILDVTERPQSHGGASSTQEEDSTVRVSAPQPYAAYVQGQDDDDDDDDEDDDDGEEEEEEEVVVVDNGHNNMTVMAPERIPASKDWRESGCVATPVNQMKCGACYAIATMNTVETMRCLNKVSSPILSSQQVIDCSTPRAGYQNHGCDGGWPTRVLKYLQDVRVVTREACYPFVRRQQTCQLRRVQSMEGCTLSASPTGSTLRYRILDNEQDILYHVARTGPVITVMQALDSFLFYSRGIYDDPKCSRRRDDVDHAIAIVGYGRENGQNYWLIKNSWGTEDWGEGGYGKYKRGTRACSIGSWGWVITS